MSSESILVLFAHGSRDPEWRRPFENLTAQVRAELGRDAVELAYMEFSPPTLEEIAVQARIEGIKRLDLLPLFLAGGAHVARDIPEQIDSLKRRFPEMEVNVLPPLGEHPRLRQTMNELVVETGRSLRRARLTRTAGA